MQKQSKGIGICTRKITGTLLHREDSDSGIGSYAVCFLKNKSEAFENFKIYKEMVENEMDSRIKCLRSDNGGEFTSKEFMDYCSSHGIKRQFYVARTPQQNGFVERKNMTVQEMA
jgi:hypothetical protein